MLGSQGIYKNGSTLTLTHIQRNISRTFICVAENTLSSGKRSTNESLFIDVQCKLIFFAYTYIHLYVTHTRQCHMFGHI